MDKEQPKNENLIAISQELLEALQNVSDYYRLDAERSQIAIAVKQILTKAVVLKNINLKGV